MGFRISIKLRFVTKLLRAYTACKYCLSWSFLACFFCILLFPCFVSALQRKQTKTSPYFMINFWCSVDSCGIPMHLLPSRWHFLSIWYLNVFLLPAFGQLTKGIFCHCWPTKKLLLDEKWLFCLLLLSTNGY